MLLEQAMQRAAAPESVYAYDLWMPEQDITMGAEAEICNVVASIRPNAATATNVTCSLMV